MKIAIHERKGSFSDRWIKYCKRNDVPYKIVNCYDSNIIDQLKDCDGLLWHWDQTEYKSALFARQLTLSLERLGIKVYPSTNTSWHYDDKVGQKYLLEAINAPFVKTNVFYSAHDARQWLKTAPFPQVFKLRCGAGSSNVWLVKNKRKARQLINKAFGSGFLHVSSFNRLKERFWMLRRDKDAVAVKKVFTGIARLFILDDVEKFSHKEKGYIYFQEFVPGNKFDTRLVVIGDRCFALRRYCRNHDFRASGSGVMAYKPELFNQEMIRTAFDVSKKLKTQSLAFDFLLDGDNPLVSEISYCFTIEPLDGCLGYWDSNLEWHEGKFNLQELILQDFLYSLNIRQDQTVISSQEKPKIEAV